MKRFWNIFVVFLRLKREEIALLALPVIFAFVKRILLVVGLLMALAASLILIGYCISLIFPPYVAWLISDGLISESLFSNVNIHTYLHIGGITLTIAFLSIGVFLVVLAHPITLFCGWIRDNWKQATKIVESKKEIV